MGLWGLGCEIVGEVGVGLRENFVVGCSLGVRQVGGIRMGGSR